MVIINIAARNISAQQYAQMQSFLKQISYSNQQNIAHNQNLISNLKKKDVTSGTEINQLQQLVHLILGIYIKDKNTAAIDTLNLKNSYFVDAMALNLKNKLTDKLSEHKANLIKDVNTSWYVKFSDDSIYRSLVSQIKAVMKDTKEKQIFDLSEQLFVIDLWLNSVTVIINDISTARLQSLESVKHNYQKLVGDISTLDDLETKITGTDYGFVSLKTLLDEKQLRRDAIQRNIDALNYKYGQDVSTKQINDYGVDVNNIEKLVGHLETNSKNNGFTPTQATITNFQDIVKLASSNFIGIINEIKSCVELIVDKHNTLKQNTSDDYNDEKASKYYLHVVEPARNLYNHIALLHASGILNAINFNIQDGDTITDEQKVYYADLDSSISIIMDSIRHDAGSTSDGPFVVEIKKILASSVTSSTKEDLLDVLAEFAPIAIPFAKRYTSDTVSTQDFVWYTSQLKAGSDAIPFELLQYSGTYNATLPSVKILADTKLLENIFFPAGSSFPVNTIFSSGFTFKAGETIPKGSTLSLKRFKILTDTITSGTVLPVGTTFTKGQVVKNMVLPASTVISSGSTLANTLVLPANTKVLASQETLSTVTTIGNLSISSGLVSGTLTADFKLPAGVSLQLAGNLTLDATKTITLDSSNLTIIGASAVTLTGDLAVGANGILLPEGQATLPFDVTLNANYLGYKSGDVITSGTALDSTALSFFRIPGKTVVVGDGTDYFPRLTVFPDGTSFPEGTVFENVVIPRGTLIPEKTVLEAGIVLPQDTTINIASGTLTIEGINYANGEQILNPGGVVLTSDLTLALGENLKLPTDKDLTVQDGKKLTLGSVMMKIKGTLTAASNHDLVIPNGTNFIVPDVGITLPKANAMPFDIKLPSNFTLDTDMKLDVSALTLTQTNENTSQVLLGADTTFPTGMVFTKGVTIKKNGKINAYHGDSLNLILGDAATWNTVFTSGINLNHPLLKADSILKTGTILSGPTEFSKDAQLLPQDVGAVKGETVIEGVLHKDGSAGKISGGTVLHLNSTVAKGNILPEGTVIGKDAEMAVAGSSNVFTFNDTHTMYGHQALAKNATIAAGQNLPIGTRMSDTAYTALAPNGAHVSSDTYKKISTEYTLTGDVTPTGAKVLTFPKYYKLKGTGSGIVVGSGYKFITGERIQKDTIFKYNGTGSVLSKDIILPACTTVTKDVVLDTTNTIKASDMGWRSTDGLYKAASTAKETDFDYTLQTGETITLGTDLDLTTGSIAKKVKLAANKSLVLDCSSGFTFSGTTNVLDADVALTGIKLPVNTTATETINVSNSHTMRTTTGTEANTGYYKVSTSSYALSADSNITTIADSLKFDASITNLITDANSIITTPVGILLDTNNTLIKKLKGTITGNDMITLKVGTVIQPGSTITGGAATLTASQASGISWSGDTITTIGTIITEDYIIPSGVVLDLSGPSAGIDLTDGGGVVINGVGYQITDKDVLKTNARTPADYIVNKDMKLPINTLVHKNFVISGAAGLPKTDTTNFVSEDGLMKVTSALDITKTGGETLSGAEKITIPNAGVVNAADGGPVSSTITLPAGYQFSSAADKLNFVPSGTVLGVGDFISAAIKFPTGTVVNEDLSIFDDKKTVRTQVGWIANSDKYLVPELHNGLQGYKLPTAVTLASGDEIKLGDHITLFKDQSATFKSDTTYTIGIGDIIAANHRLDPSLFTVSLKNGLKLPVDTKLYGTLSADLSGISVTADKTEYQVDTATPTVNAGSFTSDDDFLIFALNTAVTSGKTITVKLNKLTDYLILPADLTITDEVGVTNVSNMIIGGDMNLVDGKKIIIRSDLNGDTTDGMYIRSGKTILYKINVLLGNLKVQGNDVKLPFGQTIKSGSTLKTDTTVVSDKNPESA